MALAMLRGVGEVHNGLEKLFGKESWLVEVRVGTWNGYCCCQSTLHYVSQ